MFRFHSIERKWSNISFCFDFPLNLHDFVQRPTKSQSAMQNLWQWQYRQSKISLSWHRHDIQTSRDQWKIGYTHGDTTWSVLNLKHLSCFIRFPLISIFDASTLSLNRFSSMTLIKLFRI